MIDVYLLGRYRGPRQHTGNHGCLWQKPLEDSREYITCFPPVSSVSFTRAASAERLKHSLRYNCPVALVQHSHDPRPACSAS